MHPGLMAGSDDPSRGFRRIIYLLIWLVIVPTGLLLLVGIMMMVLSQQDNNMLFGILVITLVGCMVTGGTLSLIYLRREAKLSKLQLDFVSKVSHELRTPLTSIRMFAEMLSSDEERDPQETAVCLEVLQRETLRLTERVERLLDWGRMEAGRRIYRHELDDPVEIVAAALAAYEAAHVGKPLNIDIDVPSTLPELHADRGAVVDALVNLLSNARKYSPEDAMVTIRARHEGKNIHISVIDRGRGIPRREQKNVFQKFYRIDDLLSREVEGSGLGLAIVRHVAAGHGGHVDLESTPGEGSTFTLVFPLPTERKLRRLRSNLEQNTVSSPNKQISASQAAEAATG